MRRTEKSRGGGEVVSKKVRMPKFQNDEGEDLPVPGDQVQADRGDPNDGCSQNASRIEFLGFGVGHRKKRRNRVVVDHGLREHVASQAKKGPSGDSSQKGSLVEICGISEE